MGWMGKNRDTLHTDSSGMLLAKSVLIQELVAAGVGETAGPEANEKGGKANLGATFKMELSNLIMVALDAGAPHLVRTVKSDTAKRPATVQSDLILGQLHGLGMLEAVKIRRTWCICLENALITRWLVLIRHIIPRTEDTVSSAKRAALLFFFL